MRILIANDDGIHAPGIKLLHSIACKLSDDVWVVAPDRNCSGVSNAMTLKHPVRAHKVKDRWYVVDAYPVDCILMGVHHIMRDHLPDLVLSGINYGYNAGNDIGYSGTLAAAAEATRCGIRSIALSQDIEGVTPPSFMIATAYAEDILKQLLTHYHWQKDEFISVNFPNVPSVDLVKGTKVATQGYHRGGQMVHSILDHWGQECFWLGANDRIDSTEPGCDLQLLREGYNAITPLKVNLTNHSSLPELAKIFA